MRCGQASSKKASRGIFNNQETRQWDTCTQGDRGCNQPKKTPYIDLEDKNKNNAVFCTTVDASTTKEVDVYSDICGQFRTTSSRGNKYIYLMYVYVCNSIPATDTNNTRDKEMIRSFTDLTEDLKRCEI